MTEEKYIIIPMILFQDKRLNKTDCIIYGLLNSLSIKVGYCFCTNEYLANYINTTKRNINYSLSKLKENKYIKTEIRRGRRKIYLLNNNSLLNENNFNIS